MGKISFRESFSKDLGILLPSITAGLVNGILIVIFQSAYAALIFSGPLSEFAARGMGVMLFGAFAMGSIIALTSAFQSTVTAPQDAPTAILAIVAGSIAGSGVGLAGESLFITVVAAIALTALVTGVSFLLLGWFQLGNLVRFIPYPVVGGFLAGTGWVLVKGALGIIAGEKLTIKSIPVFLQTEMLLKWLPGLFFAVLLLVLMRKFRHFFTMPGAILVAFVSFYLILLLTGTPVSHAGEEGWLMDQFRGGAVYSPLMTQDTTQIHWDSIWQQYGDLGSITIISIISLLLNASGLELIARREIDLNRELRASGLANLASAIGGSSVGYMSLSLTALSHRIGSRSRISGLVSAGICGATLLFGWALPSYFPRPLLAGLLIYLGLTFLVEWLYNAWFKLPRIEYVLVILILMVIIIFGFLPGMAVGTAVAIVLFVINYSRIDVVKHVLTGENFQSNVDRPSQDAQLLKKHGNTLYVMQLQGFLFFGTANNILATVRVRALNAPLPSLRYVLLDFRLVTGLDSSALNSFEKLKMLAQSQSFTLIFTNLSEIMKRQLAAANIAEDDQTVIYFDDLDYGMEWVEEKMLHHFPDEKSDGEFADISILESIVSGALHHDLPQATLRNFAKQMHPYFVHKTIPENEHLIVQGAKPVGLYILESGKVTAQLELKNGTIIRLRKMQPGTVIGELSVYLQRPATASVVTNEACTVLFLATQKLRLMEEEHPELAALFHRFIVGILGERVNNSNQTLRAMQQ